MQARVRTGPPQIIRAGFQPSEAVARSVESPGIHRSCWSGAFLRILVALTARDGTRARAPLSSLGSAATPAEPCDSSSGAVHEAGFEIPAFSSAAAILPCCVFGTAPGLSIAGVSRMISRLVALGSGSLPSAGADVATVVVTGCACATRSTTAVLCCSSQSPRKNRYRPAMAPIAAGIIKALEPEDAKWKVTVPRPPLHAAHGAQNSG